MGRGAQSPGSHVLSSSQSEMARVASRDAHLRLEVSVGACRGLSFLPGGAGAYRLRLHCRHVGAELSQLVIVVSRYVAVRGPAARHPGAGRLEVPGCKGCMVACTA